jgi:hypothetical protein
MANWASTVDVLAYTNTTVTDAQITVANGVIDLFSGVTDAASGNLSARDLRLLKQATAYQTVWQVAQVDPLTRTDVASLSQDGTSFTTPTGNDDALLLSPHAKRCLDRLSWRKSRTLRVTSGEVRYSTVEAWQAAWLRDGPGTDVGWQPL